MCKGKKDRGVKYRKNILVLICATLVLLLSACKGGEKEPAGESLMLQSETSDLPETVHTLTLNIADGDNIYTVRLEDNDTVKELVKLMPMEFTMNELNGNEKFYNLPESLPTDSQNVGQIRSGDLMLYGSDCLVLFYEDFQTSFRYTRLGHLEHADGLSEAVGTGSVKVIFDVVE